MRNMAGFNQNSHNHYHTRSVSLPARSHPSTVKIEQVVNKIKTCQTSSSSRADKICNSLSGLKELYEGIEEVLAMPLTQQALAQHQEDGRINELLDESVRFIDTCSNTRDTVKVMKEGLRGLQSAIRRSKLGDLNIEKDVAVFMSCRKNIHKEISKSLTKLKHTDNRTTHVPRSILADHQLSVALRALLEASLLTMSTFSSLLLFLSVPISKSKTTRWSLVSKLMDKGVLACESKRSNLNEVDSVDIALNNLLLRGSGSCKSSESEKIESAQQKLETLGTIMEGLENELEICLGI